jgi:hypothetical protein
MSSTRWVYESCVPEKAPRGSAFGTVVVAGELYVLTHLYGDDFTEARRSRRSKKTGTMCFQIYIPKKKAWRTRVTKSPFACHVDIKNPAVLSSIYLWIVCGACYLYSLGISAKFIVQHIFSTMQVVYLYIDICLCVYYISWLDQGMIHFVLADTIGICILISCIKVC